MGTGGSKLCNDQTCPIICVDAPVLNVHIFFDVVGSYQVRFNTAKEEPDQSLVVHFFPRDMAGHTVCEWLAFMLNPNIEKISELLPTDPILRELQTNAMKPDEDGHLYRDFGDGYDSDDFSDDSKDTIREAIMFSTGQDGKKNLLILRVNMDEFNLKKVFIKIQRSLAEPRKRTWAKTFISPFANSSIQDSKDAVSISKDWVATQEEQLPWTRKEWLRQRKQQLKEIVDFTSKQKGGELTSHALQKLEEKKRKIDAEPDDYGETRQRLLKATGVAATLAAGAYGAHRAGVLPVPTLSTPKVEEAQVEAMASLVDAVRIVDSAGTKGLSATKVKELSRTLEEATSALADVRVESAKSQYSK